MFVEYIPQIVSFAEDEVGLRVERRADLAESAVAASALQAVLVPVHVQRFQEVPGRGRTSLLARKNSFQVGVRSCEITCRVYTTDVRVPFTNPGVDPAARGERTLISSPIFNYNRPVSVAWAQSRDF